MREMYKSKKREANVIISIVAFFTIFFVFCGFAIDFAAILATRAQLQTAVEAVALASVEYVASDEAEEQARKIFSYETVKPLAFAEISDITIKKDEQAILVEVASPAQVYFLSALGISNIEVQARAAARIMPKILYSDTEFNVDNHLQYTLSEPLFDKTGSEIRITKNAAMDEYRVFAGLGDRVGETKWVEITCSSADATADVQYFDLNAQCVQEKYNGGISAAKFIRLVKNNPLTPFEIEKLEIINAARLIRYSDFVNI